MPDSTPSISARAGRLVVGGSLLIGTATAGLVVAPAVGASSRFLVTNLNDSGVGSLRHALDDATIANDRATVSFDPALSGTITLTSGSLVIGDALTVIGPGSGNLTISSATSPAFFLLIPGQIPGYPPFDVTISGLTITGGATGIAAYSANLVLDDVVIDAAATGPAISQQTNNSQLSQSFTMTNSRITNSSLGGTSPALYLNVGTSPVAITNSTIANNTSANGSGGLRTVAAGSVTISGSTISGNTSQNGNGGGASFAQAVGSVTISNSTIDANTSFIRGGGLYFANSDVEIRNSTFSNNSAMLSGGGALVFGHPGTDAEISNSTITGNSSQYGSAVMMEGISSLSVSQSTISQNSSQHGTAGIFFYAGSAVSLSGTILAANAAPEGMQDLFTRYSRPATVYADHSLIGVGTYAPNITIVGSGNVRRNDPGLETLAANGGPTKTMALRADSAAIEAGPHPVREFVGNAYDQRGVLWPRVVGAAADIGAYEYPSPPEPRIPSFTG